MMKKILALLLSLIIIASLFCACNKGEPEETEASEKASSSDNETNKPIDDPVPDGTYTSENAVLLSGKDGNHYNIVYASGCKVLAQDIHVKLKELDPNGTNYAINVDTKAEDAGTPEILVGRTDRAASDEAKAALKGGLDFSVIVTGNKIAIYACTDARLKDAVKYFISNLAVTASGDVYYTSKEDYVDVYSGDDLTDIKIDGVSISNYTVIIPENANDRELSFAKALVEYLINESGVNIGIELDTVAESDNEILIGRTNRAISETLNESVFTDGEYRSSLSEDKLAMTADSNSGYSALMSAFKSALNKNNGNIEESFNPLCLTLDEIKALSVGAPYIEEKDNALYFHNYTKAQIDDTEVSSGVFNDSDGGSMGVRFDFETDSTTFTFNAPTGSFFLYINGEKRTTLNAGTHIISLDTYENETNRVTLMFSNASGSIKSMTFDSGAEVTRHEYDMKMLIIGDSITEGYQCSDSSQTWAQLIARAFNAECVIQGNGGTKFTDTPVDNNMKDVFMPDVIVVAFGYNEGYNNPDSAYTHAKAYIAKLQAAFPGARIVGLSPIHAVSDNYGHGAFDQNTQNKLATLRDRIEQAYTEMGCDVIDGETLVPCEPQYFPGLNNDGVHPNLEGHAKYAENLIPQLKELIK